MSRVNAWRRVAMAVYGLAGVSVVCAGYASATAAGNLAAVGVMQSETDQAQIAVTQPAEAFFPPPGVLDEQGPAADWPSVAKQVMPSVVSVLTIQNLRGLAADHNRVWAIPGVTRNAATELMTRYRAWQADWRLADGQRQWRRNGAGFAIEDGRYVLTAAHVIEGAAEAKIQLSNGTFRAARIVGMDEARDIAVLLIDGEPIPVSEMAAKLPSQGQAVMAVGSPAGYSFSVSAGLVSGYNIEGSMLKRDKFILVSSPIIGGNSGGPVFNARGEVVAVVSYGNVYCQGIPVDRAIAVSKAILHGSRY